MNMPVPLAIVGGDAVWNFAIVSVENAINHLLGHGIPLKLLKLKKISDWKNLNECFHTSFHNELYKKLLKLEHLPENLRIHLLYIWSDGFQKNTLVKTKKYLCNFLLFMLCCLIVYKTLQDTLFLLHLEKTKWSSTPTYHFLQQTKGLEKVTSRFCKDTNSCEPTWFEQVVIQNCQVEGVNNLSILQGGTYEKQVGHSIEFNEKTPSCKRCFLYRFKGLFSSDNKISASQFNWCQQFSDWLIDYNNTTGWIQKLSFYPMVSCTSFEESALSSPQGWEITNQPLLAPCKISFSFLLQANEYSKS